MQSSSHRQLRHAARKPPRGGAVQRRPSERPVVKLGRSPLPRGGRRASAGPRRGPGPGRRRRRPAISSRRPGRRAAGRRGRPAGRRRAGGRGRLAATCAARRRRASWCATRRRRWAAWTRWCSRPAGPSSRSRRSGSTRLPGTPPWTPSPRASFSSPPPPTKCSRPAPAGAPPGRCRCRRHRGAHRLHGPAAVGQLRRPRRRQGRADPPREAARPGLGRGRHPRLRRGARPRRPARRPAPRGQLRAATRGEWERLVPPQSIGAAVRFCLETPGVTGANVRRQRDVADELKRRGAGPAPRPEPYAPRALPFLDWSMSSLAFSASQNSMRSCDWSRSRPADLLHALHAVPQRVAVHVELLGGVAPVAVGLQEAGQALHEVAGVLRRRTPAACRARSRRRPPATACPAGPAAGRSSPGRRSSR